MKTKAITISGKFITRIPANPMAVIKRGANRVLIFTGSHANFKHGRQPAYISMVINGLFGMKFNEESLSFGPFLPAEIGSIKLKDLAYRDSKLNIVIKGKGSYS